MECIRRQYLGETSPLAEVLSRYGDFFALFEDFEGYVDFFLLQDLVSDGLSSVRFFMPYAGFGAAWIRIRPIASGRSRSSRRGTGE